MAAPTRARQGLAAALVAIAVKRGGHHDAASGMADLNVADGDVGDFTTRAYTESAALALILGPKKKGIPILGESSPRVFHEIPVDEDANRILEFEVVLDHERITGGAPDVGIVARHPLPGLPEMIVEDFDVRRSRLGRAPAKQNAFARGFDEIVSNLEGTILVVAHSA